MLSCRRDGQFVFDFTRCSTERLWKRKKKKKPGIFTRNSVIDNRRRLEFSSNNPLAFYRRANSLPAFSEIYVAIWNRLVFLFFFFSIFLWFYNFENRKWNFVCRKFRYKIHSVSCSCVTSNISNICFYDFFYKLIEFKLCGKPWKSHCTKFRYYAGNVCLRSYGRKITMKKHW